MGQQKKGKDNGKTVGDLVSELADQKALREADALRLADLESRLRVVDEKVRQVESAIWQVIASATNGSKPDWGAVWPDLLKRLGEVRKHTLLLSWPIMAALGMAVMLPLLWYVKRGA